MKCDVNIRRVALLLCNFILLLSGFALVALGCYVLNDGPRILLSNLAVEPGTTSEPPLFYVSLAFVTAGVFVSIISLVGFWVAFGPKSDWFMAVFIVLLLLLLLFEVSTGIVGTFCPQAFGGGLDPDQMVASLMNNYGVPGRDQYTAAVDLAQTLFECCGMQSGSDYDGSRWWKRERDSNHDLRVPRSCCFLQNTNNENAFLDPIPVNLTLCQAKNNARYQLGRNVKGCSDHLNTWFNEHVKIFLIIGLALVVIQLSVLMTSILYCLMTKGRNSRAEGSDSSSERSTVSKQKLHSDSEPEEKNVNAHENGFPVRSSHRNATGKQTNSKRSNYSFRNFNFMDSEDGVIPKRNELPMSAPFVFRSDNFHGCDENRNSPRNVYQGGKYQQNRPIHGYHPPTISGGTVKAMPIQSMNDNELQYEAMKHYYRKRNDLSAPNNGRNAAELGT